MWGAGLGSKPLARGPWQGRSAGQVLEEQTADEFRNVDCSKGGHINAGHHHLQLGAELLAFTEVQSVAGGDRPATDSDRFQHHPAGFPESKRRLEIRLGADDRKPDLSLDQNLRVRDSGLLPEEIFEHPMAIDEQSWVVDDSGVVDIVEANLDTLDVSHRCVQENASRPVISLPSTRV